VEAIAFTVARSVKWIRKITCEGTATDGLSISFLAQKEVEGRYFDLESFWPLLLQRLGSRGKRYSEALHDQDQGIDFYVKGKTGITINLKNNEAIVLKEFSESGTSVWDLIGRIIWNLPLRDLCDSLPIVADMADVAHTLFHPARRFRLYSSRHQREVEAVIWWASGSTPELEEIFWDRIDEARWRCSDLVALRISGDDTQIIWVFMGYVSRVLNGDFSKFDQTQRGPHISEFLPEDIYPFLLVKAKVEELVAKLRLQAPRVIANVAFKSISARLVLSVLQQMLTGRGDTSLGSFWDSFGFCALVITEAAPPGEVAKNLGFNFKEAWDDIRQSVFLKKWRVPVCDGGVWRVFDVSLPSCVVKLGKSLRSPDRYRISGEPRFAEGSARWQELLHDMARAQALSYGGIPDNYPILGAYLRKMRSFSDKSREELDALRMMPVQYEDGYRVALPEGIYINRDEIMERTVERYSCSVSEILEVEALIDSVQRLPVFISHPLFQKMLSVDY
jgi:hypothetical protein